MSKVFEIQLHSSTEDFKNHQQTVFDTLWEKISKAEKSLERAKIKQLKVVDEFNTVALPAEESFNNTRLSFIKHLMSFLSSKSLSKTHRAALLEWIDEELDGLYSSPFRGHIDFDALVHELDQNTEKEALDLNAKIPPEEAKAFVFQALGMLGIVISNETYDKYFKDKNESPEILQQAMEDFIDSIMKNIEKDDNTYTDHAADPTQSHQNTYRHIDPENSHGPAENEKPEDIINKLYKRLAQKLHPDKVSTEQEKAERHAIMHQLGQAKKDKDLYVFLNLVQQHADASDVQFSEKQLNFVLQSMHKKLQKINSEKKSLQQSDDINSLIFHLFNGRGQKDISEKIIKHKRQVKQRQALLLHFQTSLKNIKTLRQELDNREKQWSFSSPLKDFLF